MNTHLIIWIILGLIFAIHSFGTIFANFQGEYPDKSRVRGDYGFATLISLLVLVFPLAVIIPICMSGFNKYGWKLKV